MNAPIDENGFQQWQPQPNGFRYLWNHPIVIAGVMGMLLLLVTAVSIIAIKAVGNEPAAGGPRNEGGQQTTDQQAAPAATGTRTGSPPASQPTGTQETGTQPTGSTPAVNTTGAVYLSGKLDIRSYDSGVDFDTAKKNSLGDGEKYDFDVNTTALDGVNRGQAGVGAAAGAPSPAGCTAGSVKWGASAHVSVLGDGAVICVRTSDDRLAAFTVTKLDKSDSGQIQSLAIDYVVWKKQGDQ